MIVRPKVEQYAELLTTPEPPLLADVARRTRVGTPMPDMMVGALQARLLEAVIHAMRPRLVLEIGTFTGYSTLAMAAALPDFGRIITIEKDPDNARLAADNIAASPYSERIHLRVGSALRELERLDEPIDFAFIDGAKEEYCSYYDAVVPLLDDNGLIAVDNVLRFGAVADDRVQADDVVSVRRFNDVVARDPRVVQVVLTVRDGLMLIRKTRQRATSDR